MIELRHYPQFFNDFDSGVAGAGEFSRPSRMEKVAKDFDLPRLLHSRKITRAVSEHFASQLASHLHSLQPLFKPTNILGEYIRNSPKQTLKNADATLKELRSLYKRVAHAKPFQFEDELKPPIDVFGAFPEIHPVEYQYRPQQREDIKPITVTSPLRWVLTYKGLGPRRLQEVLESQSGTARMELQAYLLHYLVMHIVASRDIGVSPILRSLRYSVGLGSEERFGALPMVFVSAPIGTLLPSDEAIIQSTELSGASVFEEIVDVEAISRLVDPLQEHLTRLVKDCGEEPAIPDA